MKVIVAAAGTGGHINPGIAIANKIKEKEKDSDIIFIGTSRGIENDLVPRAGYTLKTVEAYGISKKISIKTLVNNFKTLKGFKQAEKIIKQFKPDIVIGTGGYICGGAITAAHKLGIPTVIHESNAYPGKATKFLENKLTKILLGFGETEKYFKDKTKVVETGTPTKVKEQNFTQTEKRKILFDLGLIEGLPIILVFGGSQGAKKINDAMIQLIKEGKNKNYQIIWAAGQKQYEGIKEKLEESGININNIKNTKIVPYIYNMSEIMNIADVIVSRSGAMTITEIALVGKPAIFIPLPSSSANRQIDNANILAKIGAATIILNEEVNSENLNQHIEDMIEDPKELKEKGRKAKTLDKYDVEEKIYKEISEIVKHNSKIA